MKQNFLISTGGSGGHVIPAIILYEHLKKDTNLIITTDKRGLKYIDKEKWNKVPLHLLLTMINIDID